MRRFFLLSICSLILSNSFCQISNESKNICKSVIDSLQNISKTHIDTTDYNSEIIFIDDSEFCIQFPGGDTAMREYVKNNVLIPNDTSILINGAVCASFKVNEIGEITDIKIEKGLNSIIDNEIIKALSKMPKWIWDCKVKPYNHKTIKKYLPIIINFE